MGKGIFINNFISNNDIDNITNGQLGQFYAKNETIDPYTFIDTVNENEISINNNTTSIYSPSFSSKYYPQLKYVGYIDWRRNIRIVKLEKNNLFILHVKLGNWDNGEDRYQASGNYSSSNQYRMYLYQNNNGVITLKSTHDLCANSTALFGGFRTISNDSWYQTYSGNLYKVYVDYNTNTFKTYSVSMNNLTGYYPQYGIDIQVEGKYVYITGAYSSTSSGYVSILRYYDNGSSFSSGVLIFSRTGDYDGYYDYSYYGSQLLKLSDNAIIKAGSNSSYSNLYWKNLTQSNNTWQYIYNLGSASYYRVYHLWKNNELSFNALYYFTSNNQYMLAKYNLVNNTITLSDTKIITNTQPYIQSINDTLTGYCVIYNNTVQLTLEKYSIEEKTYYYTPITLLEATSNLFSTFIGYDYIDDDNIIIYGYNSTTQSINYCSFGFDGEKINIKTIGKMPGAKKTTSTSNTVWSYYYHNNILLFCQDSLTITLYSYKYQNGELILSQSYILPTTGQSTSYYPTLLDACPIGNNLLLLVRDYKSTSYSYMCYKLMIIPCFGGQYGKLEEKTLHVFTNLETSGQEGISGGYSYQFARLCPLSENEVICYGRPNSNAYISLIKLTKDKTFVVNSLDTGKVSGLAVTSCTSSTEGDVFFYTQ